jgi:hypothetical protein
MESIICNFTSTKFTRRFLILLWLMLGALQCDKWRSDKSRKFNHQTTWQTEQWWLALQVNFGAELSCGCPVVRRLPALARLRQWARCNARAARGAVFGVPQVRRGTRRRRRCLGSVACARCGCVPRRLAARGERFPGETADAGAGAREEGVKRVWADAWAAQAASPSLTRCMAWRPRAMPALTGPAGGTDSPDSPAIRVLFAAPRRGPGGRSP